MSGEEIRVEEVVIVARLQSGDDLIAVLSGAWGDRVKLQHPYYAKYSAANRSITMIPYCPLSDEVTYEFPKDSLQFLVPATKDVADKFLQMVSVDLDTASGPDNVVALNPNKTKH